MAWYASPLLMRSSSTEEAAHKSTLGVREGVVVGVHESEGVFVRVEVGVFDAVRLCVAVGVGVPVWLELAVLDRVCVPLIVFVLEGEPVTEGVCVALAV